MISIFLNLACLVGSIILGDARLITLEVLCLFVVIVNTIDHKVAMYRYMEISEKLEFKKQQERINALYPFRKEDV